jgi:hypothetical protein
MASPPAVKLIALLRKKRSLTREEFRNHYELSHAPLAIQLAPFMAKYTRDFVIEDPRATTTLEASPSAYDVVTQIWFNTEKDFENFNAAMARPESRHLLVADEERFLDRDATQIFLVRTCHSDLENGAHVISDRVNKSKD